MFTPLQGSPFLDLCSFLCLCLLILQICCLLQLQVQDIWSKNKKQGSQSPYCFLVLQVPILPSAFFWPFSLLMFHIQYIGILILCGWRNGEKYIYSIFLEAEVWKIFVRFFHKFFWKCNNTHNNSLAKYETYK